MNENGEVVVADDVPDRKLHDQNDENFKNIFSNNDRNFKGENIENDDG